ncbi:MAG: hypothetical protein VKP57_04325 [Candidatus Sericytochromatia bacterium]|nr:hypothetical protein [Candidatus Sericytochromatia bacterium]
MDLLTRLFDFGGDRQVELFKAACSQRDPILYLFVEEAESWHLLLVKYLLPIMEWRLSLFPEDPTPAFEIHGEQSIMVERESSGKLPEVALLNVFPMVPDSRDFEPFMRQYEKFQNLYPYVFRCRPRYASTVKMPTEEVEGCVELLKLSLGMPSARLDGFALDTLRYASKELERQATLAQIAAARIWPPTEWRAGHEPQAILTARLIAWQTLVARYPEDRVTCFRKLMPPQADFIGQTAQDNFLLDTAIESGVEQDPERAMAFQEFRYPDLWVANKAWVEIETLVGAAAGDQDPFAAFRRKLRAKSAFWAGFEELWLVLPPSLVAFFPEAFEAVHREFSDRGVAEASGDGHPPVRMRFFIPDYGTQKLHEVTPDAA